MKHVKVLVTADKVDKVNEILERQGLGPDYIGDEYTNDQGALTHRGLERLVNKSEYAAIKLALDKVAKNEHTIDVKKGVYK